MTLSVRRFTLSDAFLEPYKTREPDWGPLGYVTFKRTYARKIEEEGRTEEWWETCRRVIEGMFTIQKKHCNELLLPWNDSKAQRTAKDAYERLFAMKWTPPGRGLWMMGTPYIEERTGAAVFNCSFISTQDIASRSGDIFSWIMDALMLGIGVGFDTRGAGLLNVIKPEGTLTYQVPDSREGWVNALKILLDSYAEGSPAIAYDYSLVRGYGIPIKGFGGTSSGSAPLSASLEDIRKLLDSRVGSTLSSVDIVDIANLIGRCVVAGNVRRSAELALGDPSDTDYTSMKDYSLFPEQLSGWRWNSNNSVAATIGMDYSKLGAQTAVNGEPGYIWLDTCRAFGRLADPPDYSDMKVMGVNPCAEITLESRELCNIAETYMARHTDLADYQRTLKVAYLYAKTVTLLNTHWPETNAVMLKNRRIGLSQSGIVQAIKKFGYRAVMNNSDASYAYLKRLDRTYSDWLCVPMSKKITTVKPSGSVSLLNGSTPGIHFPKGEYYIRRIRFSSEDPLIPLLEEAGYHIQNDVYGNEESRARTKVVDFPVQESYFWKSVEDVSMWQQLALTADYQKYWADNSVSVTIEFKEEEAAAIPDALDMYQDRLKTVSFLPHRTHGYALPPYEPITKEEYEKLSSNIKPLSSLSQILGVGEKYCDGDKCMI